MLCYALSSKEMHNFIKIISFFEKGDVNAKSKIKVDVITKVTVGNRHSKSLSWTLPLSGSRAKLPNLNSEDLLDMQMKLNSDDLWRKLSEIWRRDDCFYRKLFSASPLDGR